MHTLTMRTPCSHIAILMAFVINILGPIPQVHANSILDLPPAGSMVNLSSAYMPVLIKGLRVHSDNPFLFDFILSTGDSGLNINSQSFKDQSQKLIKYFLAALTIKEDDLWVNLSPSDWVRRF